MNTRRKVFFAVTTLFLMAELSLAPRSLGQKSAEGKEATDPLKTFTVHEGFQGPLTLKTKAGKNVSLRVSVRTLAFDGTLGRQTIKTSDFTLFQMRGGKIKVFTEGREEIRSADASWTLPAGATLTFEVKGETALLDATTISVK